MEREEAAEVSESVNVVNRPDSDVAAAILKLKYGISLKWFCLLSLLCPDVDK